MDIGTIIALAAMLISLSAAIFKWIDRRKARKKEELETYRKDSTLSVERDSIVVRGAEGALVLMEKALKTSNDECEKRIAESNERIQELEEENDSVRCELNSVKNELYETKKELLDTKQELRVIRAEMREMQTRMKGV